MISKSQAITFLTTTAITSLAIMNSPAYAQSPEAPSVQIMQAQIAKLQAELDALKAQMAEVAEQAKQTQETQAAQKTEQSALAQKVEKASTRDAPGDIKVAWKGAPEISNADGSFKMKMRGKVMVDFGYLHSANPAFGIHNDTNSQSSSEFRLLRLGIDGTIQNIFSYRVEADFAGNKTTVTDAYLQYTGSIPSVMIGQFKPYYSLDELTSDVFTPMMERPAYDGAFNFNRRVGVGAAANGSNWSASAGLFNVDAGTVGANENGYLISGRLTYAPIAEKSRSIHLGAAAFYRKNSQTVSQMQYKGRPENHTSGVSFVDTGKFNSNSDTFLGLELATVYNSFSAQAEYGRLEAHRTGLNVSNPAFWGGEVTLSYFLTGEHRNYKPDQGVFDRVHVTNPVKKGSGYGAFEILGRIDHLDLEDKGIMGGRQTAYMLGLNWYPIDYVKFALNYSYVDVTNGRFVDASGKNKVNVLGGRAQIDF
jgi:phosphate-selective porin OprO/OprP